MAETIGEQLKQARTKRGLTLEQASKATHIRVHFLEALENNQRDALPSTVQGRGFLRLYADLLNLPTADLLAAWEGKTLVVAAVSPVTTPPIAGASPANAEKQDVTAAAPIVNQPAGDVFLNKQDQTSQAPIPVYPDNDEALNGSPAIFREIGQTLRQQREALGLSQAEVERYTRLRQHYVQAMEDGRIDQLPSAVQGRGMLSNYAAFLNLNEEKLLLRFAEGLQTRRIERIPKAEPQGLFNKRKRPAKQAPLWRRFLTPDLIFGIGVAGIILFFVLWTAARINNLRTTESKPTPPGISEVLLTPLSGGTGTPDGTTVPKGTNVAGESTNSGANAGNLAGTPGPDAVIPSQASPTDQPGGKAGTGLSSEKALQTPAGGTPVSLTSEATIPPINSDPLQVYIVAKQRAWLRVTTDDKVKFLGRTIPGNAYAFSGTKRIEMITGNGAALQVFYNQKDLGTLGTAGEVISLIFSPAGMMTPTAAFTVTSTPTKPSTATPLPSPTPQATPTITPYIPTK